MELNFFTVVYLLSLPFLIFSGLSPLWLFFSVAIGYILFCLFQKPSLKVFFLFLLTISVSLILVKPRIGLDMGLLNSINAQRGEHPNFQVSFLAKVIHNRTELVHSFVSNIDKLISLKSIFAAGFWHKISSYYPLGYLFPWDIYFLYKYLFKIKNNYQQYSRTLFTIAISITLLITGLIYIDEAILFAFSIVFFIALLVSQGYNSISKSSKTFFVILNISFLIYQMFITNLFKI